MPPTKKKKTAPHAVPGAATVAPYFCSQVGQKVSEGRASWAAPSSYQHAAARLPMESPPRPPAPARHQPMATPPPLQGDAKFQNLVAYSLDQGNTLGLPQVHDIENGTTALTELVFTPKTAAAKKNHKKRAQALLENTESAKSMVHGLLRVHGNMGTPELAKRYDSFARPYGGAGESDDSCGQYY